MDVLENGQWVVNPVAPNKESLVNINADKICQLTDLEGNTRQARGYAGFSIQGVTSTADNNILAPTENVFDPVTRGSLPPAPDSAGWTSIIEHCKYLTDDPALPFINSIELLNKGLLTLGNLTRCITPADEFSPCGEVPNTNCFSYSLHGPIKLGYLYGWAGDYRGSSPVLNQNLIITSLGGCKLSFQAADGIGATLPYSPGFTQYGSLMPLENEISLNVPSESFIVLDGSRAIRIRLNTWFAVTSDPAYKNYFGLLDTFLAGDTNVFVDNPYIEGEDYSAGMQWFSVNQQGQIMWGSTIQHIGGFSYWVTKKYCEEVFPPIDYSVLDVLVKAYYTRPLNPDGSGPIDPLPDPWSSDATTVSIDRGTRPPDNVQWLHMGPITTVVSTGDPLFNVEPEYSENQGYTVSFPVTLPNILFIHFAYYYNGILVGQKYVQNFQPRTGYFPQDILNNTTVGEGCMFDSGPYMSAANFNLFPLGANGMNLLNPLHSVITQRNGLEIQFQAVVPVTWGDCEMSFGDGTPNETIPNQGSVIHTYANAGMYLVTITNATSGYSSSTYYQVTA